MSIRHSRNIYFVLLHKRKKLDSQILVVKTVDFYFAAIVFTTIVCEIPIIDLEPGRTLPGVRIILVRITVSRSNNNNNIYLNTYKTVYTKKR